MARAAPAMATMRVSCSTRTATALSSPRRLTQLAHPGVLAALATFGVLLQLILSLQLARSSGKSVLDGLIVYLGYFTILTNMLVGAVALAGVLAPQGRLYRANMVG